MSFKLAIFTGSPISHLVKATLHHVLQRFRDCQILVLVAEQSRSLAKLARSQVKNLHYRGWRWAPYQGRNLVRALAGKAKRRGDAKPLLAISAAHDATLDDGRVRVERFFGLEKGDALRRLKAFAPDLGVSLYGPILQPAMFNCPRLGTINLHQGRLPHYRGRTSAFWEIWNGEREVQVSVHRVDAGLQTGAVIATDKVLVEPYSTPASVAVRLDALSPPLVGDAIEALRAGTAVATPQTGIGVAYRRPRLAQELQLEQRLSGGRTLAKRFKSAALSSYSTLSGFRRAKRDCVSVLLYHRVSDAYRDNVTCGVETFDRHIAYLADHHRVVPLARLLDGPMPSGDGPVVAITFDDGYLDNFEQAAPILSKHGLPATFFVSTRIVDEQLIFPHDALALGHGVPTMTWDQMRQMKAEGFDIGGHTALHVNMAAVDDVTAEAELTYSREQLRENLGIDAPLFAYPYGKATDFTPQRLAQVKAAGYIANCSAYGGVNGLAVDRWNIRRFGIDYRFDVAALRSRIYGWGA